MSKKKPVKKPTKPVTKTAKKAAGKKKRAKKITLGRPTITDVTAFPWLANTLARMAPSKR